MRFILSFILIVGFSASFANQGQIKTIKAYNKEYQDIEDLIDPLKKTIIIFSVTWCTPCRILKKKLETNSNIDHSLVQILYVATDEGDECESPDGLPNDSISRSLFEMKQLYWPFILLFKEGSKKPVSKFPVSNEKSACLAIPYYDRILDFIEEDKICKQ